MRRDSSSPAVRARHQRRRLDDPSLTRLYRGEAARGEIDVLANELPFQVLGYPTHFRHFEGSEAHHGRLGFMTPRNERPIDHGVSVTTVRRFFRSWLRVDPLADVELSECLVMSEQNLRMVTSGHVLERHW